jgi:hypothetical protein
MPMRRSEMGNPDGISNFSRLFKHIGRTLLGFIAVEIAVIDDTHGFAYRDCSDTDNRLRRVRRAICGLRVPSYLYAEQEKG